MIELAMIFYGARIVRKTRWALGIIGILWFLAGAFFFVNAFVEEYRINPIYFIIPILIDCVISAISAIRSVGTTRSVRCARVVVFLSIAILIGTTAGGWEIIVGFAVGSFLLVDAAWRAASAYVVRFITWRRALVFSGVECALAIWSFLPWPTYYKGQVGFSVGLVLMLSAIGVCAGTWRLFRMPPGFPISKAVAEGLLEWEQEPSFMSAPTTISVAKSLPQPRKLPEATEGTPARISATVHVWTPSGALVSADRAISRYVAARDAAGTISTGHAAFEAQGIYISHYPAVDIDRSPSDFRKTLRATRDNDVPGRFLPSYPEEAADWCPSTMKVAIPQIDGAALRQFWGRYSGKTTYNLANRNCSSAVAAALDAGLEGVFEPYARSPLFLLRLLMSPELWVAAQLRRRATAMAWTPGIVLDYARAVSYLLSCPARWGFAPRTEAVPAAMPQPN